MPAASGGGAMVRIPGHVLPALARATRIKESRAEMRAKGSEPMRLTLVLKHDDQKGFERYLHDVYRRKSANFRRFLTQREIAARFGPSRKDYDDVLAYLRKNGFKLTDGSTNRMTITVLGTRREAERAFDVEIGDYRIADRRFRANAHDPALPSGIAAHVESIVGLANLARPHHAVVSTTRNLAAASCPVMEALCTGQVGAAARQIWADTCLSSLRTQGSNDWENNLEALSAAECQHAGSPAVALRAADAAQPPARTVTRGAALDGSGQTIGLIEFDSFRQSDVFDYFAYLGFPGYGQLHLSEVKVSKGAAPGPDEDEVLLDIDTVLTLAPGAQVVVYDAPFSGAGTSFQELLNDSIGGNPKIISNSWSYCEDQTTPADVQSIDALFQQAAMASTTIINDTGDSGNTCLDGSAGIIGVPADSPNATAVGGSALTSGPGLTYGSETWWDGANDTPPTGQGGYGTSEYFSTPAYQSGLNAGPVRSIPDVVANADPAAGTEICEADAGGCPTGLIYGGTSFSAPVWAAYIARLSQEYGGPLGFLNPLLYQFAGTAAFHNAASMGSDFAHVGLGSLNLDALYVLWKKIAVGPAGVYSTTTLFVKPAADGSVPGG